VARDIGASRAWSGVPGAVSVVGTALGSALLSYVMARRGRRAGLSLGWAIGVGGAVAALVAVSASTFVGLLAAMLLIGIAHASNQLSRFAAADLHPEARRPSVLGWVVWSSTIGAALGPSLLAVGKAAAGGLGIPTLSGGFLIVLVFYVAALTCAVALRPDPTQLAQPDTDDPVGVIGLRAMGRLPHVQAALVIMTVGQVAMVLIMTMTPLHISEHGHGVGVVGLVMSSHLVGMFAFAPPIGRLVSRIGSLRAAMVGMSALTLAGIGASASPADSGYSIGASLFLGLGWCFCFVAGSALLTRGLAYAQRVRLQGAVDGLVWTSSAAASLSSGVILEMWGFSTLSLIGTAIVVASLALVASGRLQLEPAPAVG
jgi:MFS family permease